MKPLLPPLHVAIAASFAFMAGTISLVGIVAGIISGRPAFNLGMLAILLGWGLLCRKRAVRNWLIFFSGLFFLGSVGHAADIIWKQISGKEPWVPVESPHDLIFLGIIALVSLYTLVVLCLPRHKEWFKPVRLPDEQLAAEREGAKFIVFPVLAVSLVLAAIIHLGEWWIEEMLREPYPLEVRVIGYDEETGKELGSLSGPPPDDGGSRDERPRLPRYFAFSDEQRKGDHVFQSRMIRGVFSRPFEFTLSSSDDYEPTTVKLDRESPEVIRVPMKRKK